MARLSRQTREIIKTVIVLLVFCLLLVVYAIYPFNKAKTLLGRSDLDTYSPDSLEVKEIALFQGAGLPADTFRVDADGLTTVAGVFIPCSSEGAGHVRGTVILLPADNKTTDSLVSLAAIFHDSGYGVITYDQRASGASSGAYHGEGYYEASDLESVISYLELRGHIVHPLTVVGFQLGADAGLLAQLEEGRIDAVAAISPYLTTQNLLDALRERTGTFWFPFYRTTIFWWYNIRSSYAAPKRTIDDIKPVVCRTLVLVSKSFQSSAAVEKLKAISPGDKLTIGTIPDSRDLLNERIISFVTTGI